MIFEDSRCWWILCILYIHVYSICIYMYLYVVSHARSVSSWTNLHLRQLTLHILLHLDGCHDREHHLQQKNPSEINSEVGGHFHHFPWILQNQPELIADLGIAIACLGPCGIINVRQTRDFLRQNDHLSILTSCCTCCLMQLVQHGSAALKKT